MLRSRIILRPTIRRR